MKALSVQSITLDETVVKGVLSAMVPRVVDLILPGRREPPSELPASGALSGGRAAAVGVNPRPPKARKGGGEELLSEEPAPAS
eukprot:12211460-Alexandrium_andersonii.AAC.1